MATHYPRQLDSAARSSQSQTRQAYRISDNHSLDRKTLQIIGKFGRRGRNAGQWHWMHTLAADAQGNLYTGEGNNAKRGQRFLFKGVSPSATN